jgi:hypothetical protein
MSMARRALWNSFGLCGLIVGLVLSWPAVATPRTDIMVVASLHGLHKTDPHYRYEDLFHLIEAFHPAWVGLEIRPEDMNADSAYLTNLYPHEMLALKDLHGEKTFGFDWFGDDWTGRPVMLDALLAGPIKSLERQTDDDAELKTPERRKLGLLIDALSQEEHVLLEGITPGALNDGTYDRISSRRYALMRRQVAGTRFSVLTEFYDARDAHIADAIGRFIEGHPGQRIAIVTGADHHGPLIKALKTRFATAIRLVPVRQPQP